MGRRCLRAGRSRARWRGRRWRWCRQGFGSTFWGSISAFSTFYTPLLRTKSHVPREYLISLPPLAFPASCFPGRFSKVRTQSADAHYAPSVANIARGARTYDGRDPRNDSLTPSLRCQGPHRAFFLAPASSCVDAVVLGGRFAGASRRWGSVLPTRTLGQLYMLNYAGVCDLVRGMTLFQLPLRPRRHGVPTRPPTRLRMRPPSQVAVSLFES